MPYRNLWREPCCDISVLPLACFCSQNVLGALGLEAFRTLTLGITLTPDVRVKGAR